MPLPSPAVPPARPLIVVSNREPYLHRHAGDGRIEASLTTGGVSVALDALMRDRGGTWIAHGAGDADRHVVDAHDRVAVPPDQPSYTLRRVWLSGEEERRYYGGFANEGLWPLCHIVHVRPAFRTGDWMQYRAVNARFARAIAEELRDDETPVFLQDYHLALVSQELRRLKPKARIAQFWHIPWPHPDRLRMCPWRREIMQGLLANDLLAFQLERDRHNFLLGLKYDLGIDADRSAVTSGTRTTHVMAKPISVDFERISKMADAAAVCAEMERLRRQLRLDDPRIEIVGIGVDRLDYTKGIPERLDAIDALLTARPDLRTKLAFVQIGVPSRSALESYAALEADIDARVAAINSRHGNGSQPGPLRYWKGGLETRPLVALYRLATFCIVSSLHDGMNLIAKEFAAARNDEDGVLLLSEMTGAAQELSEALILNPYDQDGFVRLIERAITMSRDERRRRMRAMRRIISGHTVFAWASGILGALDQLAVQPPSIQRFPATYDRFVPARHAGFGRLATDAVG